MSVIYECLLCGKKQESEQNKTPECCGKHMQELIDNACREAGPEAARPMKAEEPCEDFTGNQES